MRTLLVLFALGCLYVASIDADFSINCYHCRGFNYSEPAVSENNTKSCSDDELNTDDMGQATKIQPAERINDTYLSCVSVAFSVEGRNHGKMYFMRFAAEIPFQRHPRSLGAMGGLTPQLLRQAGVPQLGDAGRPARVSLVRECNTDLCNGGPIFV